MLIHASSREIPLVATPVDHTVPAWHMDTSLPGMIQRQNNVESVMVQAINITAIYPFQDHVGKEGTLG